MEKLTVVAKDAPVKSVMAILSTWGELAEIIEQRVTLPKGCRLVWNLHFQHVAFRGHVLSGFCGTVKPEDKGDCWESYSTVCVVYSVGTLPGEGGKDDRISIPLVSVDEIMINDNGTFWWHGEMKKPAENTNDVDRLVLALNEGKLPTGHNYTRNSRVPTLGDEK